MLFSKALKSQDCWQPWVLPGATAVVHVTSRTILKNWYCHEYDKINLLNLGRVIMINNIGNNETWVTHGLSGLVLKCQLWMNSEKLKRRISITQCF